MKANNLQVEHEHSPSVMIKPHKMDDQQIGWKKLVKDIVRPPRYIYQESDLGSATFTLNQIRYHRSDCLVIHQNKKIALSIYEPDHKNNWLILYLHGNSSSKMEAMGILQHLPLKFSLAAFDFIGCGLNEQANTISLGYRQALQVKSVVEELEKRNFKIILWGRSMGAATALRFGKAPIIVADSSFHSFKSLCEQTLTKNAPKYLPNCLLSCIFPCLFYKLRTDVKKEAEYDIQSLDILKAIQNIDLSSYLIFVSGSEDILVDKSHSQLLYNSFNGKNKKLQIFEGTHNSKRPITFLKMIMKKIADYVLTYEQAKQKPISKGDIQVQLAEEETP